MTAYTSARRSVRYDRTMPSGASPRLKALITNSRSTRLLPTRKTPGGSSHNGTVTDNGSKSTVVTIHLLLSAYLHDCTLRPRVSIQSGFKELAELTDHGVDVSLLDLGLRGFEVVVVRRRVLLDEPPQIRVGLVAGVVPFRDRPRRAECSEGGLARIGFLLRDDGRPPYQTHFT